jgi:hypothetical protein
MSTTAVPPSSVTGAALGAAASAHRTINGAVNGAVSGFVELAREAESLPPPLTSGAPVESRGDEHFLPVTSYALVDRLTDPQAWAPGTAAEVRRFFRYLDYWRHQRHAASLMGLVEAYEAFSPDSDLFVTRVYSEGEKRHLLAKVVTGLTALVEQANYTIVPRDKIADTILSKESHYGLDLKVDFEAFDELLVAFRGESVTRAERRRISQFFRREEFDVPIFRRMVVMFKLKPLERHIEDVRARDNVSRQEAERRVRRARRNIPAQIDSDSLYIKIFKNIPKSDVEMVFPNTEVKFRTKDKVWLGVTGGGAVGAGVFGAAGKLALAFSNPVTAAGAVGGIGMVLFRQVMNVMNQKNRYMQVLAQNLYFHSMADNRGAMTKLADRAAEEDFKEEILLYSVLAKERVHRSELRDVDRAIENYIGATFGLQVDFELDDALGRLMADGIVTQDADGNLTALPPAEAAERIDGMWDQILDMLPDRAPEAGREIERPHVLNGSQGGLSVLGRPGAAP